jgi:hypothetical protein
MDTSHVRNVEPALTDFGDSKEGYYPYHRFHGKTYPAMYLPMGSMSSPEKDIVKEHFAVTMIPDNMQRVVSFLSDHSVHCLGMSKAEVYPDPANKCVHAYFQFPEMEKKSTRSVVESLSTAFNMSTAMETELKVFYVSSLRNSLNWITIIRKRINSSTASLPPDEHYTPEGVMRFECVHQIEELKQDDIQMLSHPGTFKIVQNCRNQIAYEKAYDEVQFARTSQAPGGWPALFAIMYNLWWKFDFDRNNFPCSILRPLHIYLVGKSQIGKTTLVKDIVRTSNINGQRRSNEARMVFPAPMSSNFKWSTINPHKPPMVVHFEEFLDTHWDSDQLQR